MKSQKLKIFGNLKNKVFSSKIIAILAIMAMFLVVGCQQQPGNESLLSVTGTSELTFDPDEAEVWVGISVLKDNAQDAQNEANRVINAIVDGLRYKGIQEKDISTEQLNLYEEQEWTESGYKSKGWRAAQTLKVKTIDLTKVGTIVDIAVNNGANQINSINFGLSNEKEQLYKKQALELATKDARDKAEILASASGAKIVKVKSLSEPNYYYQPYRYAMMDSVAGESAVKEAAQVLPQDVTITGNVNIVYVIK